MTRFRKAFAFGFFTGLLGVGVAFNPVGLGLEENFGLSLLFNLRGARAAPEEVVVIALDKRSADQLNLPRDTRKWPRSYHAKLIDRLSDEGASVIAFDILFKEKRENDALLREAIEDAGNVVLIETIEKESLHLNKRLDQGAGKVVLEKLVPPTPEIAAAALSLAPFPLPKVPARVNQFWTFKHVSVDFPTMPVVVFQIFALNVFDEMHSLFEKVLSQANLNNAKQEQINDASIALTKKLLTRTKVELINDKKINQYIQNLKAILGKETFVSGKMKAALQNPALKYSDRLKAVINMYTAGKTRYLNFYGPPGTITTVPFYQALQGSAKSEEGLSPFDFKGKAVFIGSSERLPDSRKKDDFHTVFSQETGLYLSGVEIAATAFANLLKESSLRLLSPAFHLFTLLLWGCIVAMLWFLLSPVKAFFSTVGATLLLIGIAYRQFESSGLWYPVIIPLFVQMPIAIMGALLWNFADAKKEQRQIKKAFAYYLPDKVVERLSGRIELLNTEQQIVEGIVLYSDIENYTVLSESMPPKDLAALMSNYYETIFAPVEKYGGIVLNVTGDAMLAIWTGAELTAGLKRQACSTAIAMAEVLDRFNQDSGRIKLRTRIGIHCGEIFLGNIGGGHRLEYTAIGDTANTASRIEGLNKYLNTDLLISQVMREDLDGFLTRPLGVFLMAGKRKPLIIHELVSYLEHCHIEQEELCRLFSSGLELYRERCWREALEYFSKVLNAKREDGPSLLYIKQCQHNIKNPPPPSWDGVIQLEKK